MQALQFGDKRVVLSRDVRWAEWNKLKPTDGVSIFEK